LGKLPGGSRPKNLVNSASGFFGGLSERALRGIFGSGFYNSGTLDWLDLGHWKAISIFFPNFLKKVHWGIGTLGLESPGAQEGWFSQGVKLPRKNHICNNEAFNSFPAAQ